MSRAKKAVPFHLTLFVAVCEHGVVGHDIVCELPRKMTRAEKEGQRQESWDIATNEILCTRCSPNAGSPVALYELKADIEPPAPMKGKTLKFKMTATGSAQKED